MSSRRTRVKRAHLGARGKRWGWAVWGAAAAMAVALGVWWEADLRACSGLRQRRW